MPGFRNGLAGNTTPAWPEGASENPAIMFASICLIHESKLFDGPVGAQLPTILNVSVTVGSFAGGYLE